jgi:hypothetical protein
MGDAHGSLNLGVELVLGQGLGIPPREAAQVRHDGGDPLNAIQGGREHLGDVLAQLRGQLLPRLEIPVESVHVALHIGQRVVDLVGDARGEHAQAGEPVLLEASLMGLRKLLVPLSEPLQRPPQQVHPGARDGMGESREDDEEQRHERWTAVQHGHDPHHQEGAEQQIAPTRIEVGVHPDAIERQVEPDGK